MTFIDQLPVEYISQSIPPGYKLPIPKDLNCKDGDYIAASSNGHFKIAQPNDWVFGKVQNNWIVVIYAFKL